MIRQRPIGSAAAVRASAEHLPFTDAAFDAFLGVLTVHHWSNRRAGLREMVRVARARAVAVYPTDRASRRASQYVLMSMKRFAPSARPTSMERGNISAPDLRAHSAGAQENPGPTSYGETRQLWPVVAFSSFSDSTPSTRSVSVSIRRP